jgi:predicted dienelactone hydrolase
VGIAGFSAGGYTAHLTVGAKPDFSRLKPYCARHPDSVLCSGRGDVRISSPPVVLKSDVRIRAAFAMSPVAVFLDPTSLSTISVPVGIYAAGDDSVLPVQDNARWLRDRLPGLVDYKEIAGADHFVFLTPCSKAMGSATPDLCVDRPGVDRYAIHETLNGDMFRFFQRHFGKTRR